MVEVHHNLYLKPLVIYFFLNHVSCVLRSCQLMYCLSCSVKDTILMFDEDCKHLRGASDPAKVALSHPIIEVGDVKDSRGLF